MKVQAAADGGTTSAHAENTKIMAWAPAYTWNYLRARGEYRRRGHQKAEEAELPPRTRRIPYRREKNRFFRGTTSAHAENTALHRGVALSDRNYLRARGEYPAKSFTGPANSELPPRTRRIHHRHHTRHGVLGTTSAHAENTTGFQPLR